MSPKQYCYLKRISASEFGRRVGLSKYQACRLVKGSHRTSAKRAREIERKTRGLVTRYDLRPDVFGRKPKLSTPVAQDATASQPATAA